MSLSPKARETLKEMMIQVAADLDVFQSQNPATISDKAKKRRANQASGRKYGVHASNPKYKWVVFYETRYGRNSSVWGHYYTVSQAMRTKVQDLTRCNGKPSSHTTYIQSACNLSHYYRECEKQDRPSAFYIRKARTDLDSLDNVKPAIYTDYDGRPWFVDDY
jgi:hypothetical protein